ncbi:helix-turn-helix domain-containing protein [Providencia alcalifaciens]|uniref:helix-turn-helix domain-containing protein n=1 Tax=Providencia alcalifaciens TaxID=126385 RepID=UPI003D2CD930
MSEKQNIYALLGNHLRKGLSGQELATIIQLSQQQVSRYELGVNKLSLDKLIEIAILLEMDIHEITMMITRQFEKEKNNSEKVMLASF